MLQMVRVIFLLMLLGLSNARAFQGQTFQGKNLEVSQISLAGLPLEVRDTLRSIKRGAPYSYERDGVIFGNYERRLPKQSRGYYHEYTVRTPGARNRGARRIITGGQDEYYYTADHYQSFKRIRE
jgi:ribonuclease T1